MQTIAWIAIGAEIILLLVWVWSLFIKPNGTDPAGKGIAMLFVLGLVAYIVISIILLMLNQNWSTILALVMAVIPLTIVVIGFRKHLRDKKNHEM